MQTGKVLEGMRLKTGNEVQVVVVMVWVGGHYPEEVRAFFKLRNFN